MKISHDYENRSGGGLFGWSHPPEDYMQTLVDQYCIDDGTSRALAKALARPPDADGEVYSVGMSWNIAYVLRTANSWAGPIGRFKLTLDKGAPGNIISLCADGIKKTGPTTFVMEKTDFVPGPRPGNPDRRADGRLTAQAVDATICRSRIGRWTMALKRPDADADPPDQRVVCRSGHTSARPARRPGSCRSGG